MSASAAAAARPSTMDKTFITMHDLSSEARIVYASASVADVLGYPPEEVVGLSCFDFFHPDELPFARKVHTRGVRLDRAAVLVYCRVKHKDGSFIHCETIFSVVYDVFVAATTLHIQTSKSQGRALTAPVIRRVFSSSPNDPRYHMLTHLSTKFRMGNSQDQGTHEPRVALILNRFTRTLTVLYASHATSSIFGIEPDQLIGKSFFECIQENCLQDAVDALERAKENDSIAYLRFRWRDPTNAAPAEEVPQPPPAQRPLRRSQRISSQAKRKLETDDSDGGINSSERPSKRRSVVPKGENPEESGPSRVAAGSSAVEGPVVGTSTASVALAAAEVPPIRDVEAVVSCTSDGLVVILRHARPLIPKPLHNLPNGIFASPWAPVPLVPNLENTPDKSREISFMEAIREVAVFAWSLRQLGGEIIVNSEGEGTTNDSKPDLGELDKGKSNAKPSNSELTSDQGKPASSPPAVANDIRRREPRGRPKNGNRKQSRR
ncbi:hypothetical protein ABW20_dc0109645 [Dactylellina cionopaga]|nr:hypothetical protein ABW20_dc0109645 [Dactylellina cionopaga]